MTKSVAKKRGKKKMISAATKEQKAAARDLKKETVFLKYQNLARSLAGKFSRQYGKPYEEMVECAEYALCLELFGRKQYEKKFGAKRSTWLYTVVYFHLTQVCTRGVHPCPRYEGSMQVQIRQWSPEIPFSCISDDSEDGKLDPAQEPTRIQKLLAELSEEAKALVWCVLAAPKEIADVLQPRTVRHAREALRAYLIDEMDWSSEMVERAWNEVTGAMV